MKAEKTAILVVDMLNDFVTGALLSATEDLLSFPT